MVRCVFEQTVTQNLHFFINVQNVDVIYNCLQNFAWIHKAIIKRKCIGMCYSYDRNLKD